MCRYTTTLVWCIILRSDSVIVGLSLSFHLCAAVHIYPKLYLSISPFFLLLEFCRCQLCNSIFHTFRHTRLWRIFGCIERIVVILGTAGVASNIADAINRCRLFICCVFSKELLYAFVISGKKDSRYRAVRNWWRRPCSDTDCAQRERTEYSYWTAIVLSFASSRLPSSLNDVPSRQNFPLLVSHLVHHNPP